MLPDKKPERQLEDGAANRDDSRAVVAHLEHYSGALPHPKQMREWEELVPGSAKMIFQRFETQSNHRIDIETRVVRANNFKQYIGPIFAFTIAMTTIIGGIWIAVTAQPIVGTGLSLTGLAAVIGPFLLNEYQKSQRDR